MNKSEAIIKLLDKAIRSIDAAEVLFNQKFYDFSISRAYYSMFYSGQAVLLSKDLSYTKHSAVIANFGKEFVKSKIFEKKLKMFK